VGGAFRRAHARRFARLLHAKPEERERVEISRNGLHWEELDEDISIAGLIAGRDDQTTTRRQVV
jgi:hypothetical protein